MNKINTWQSIQGIKLAAVAAGIRYQNRADLVLIQIPEKSQTAAVFTQNKFCAAPVIVARRHLKTAQPLYLLINSGNANAGTGEAGLTAAYESCRLVAAATGVAMNQVLPFSTGVIGEDLPTNPIAQAVPRLLQKLDENAWPEAAQAIMTTDTVVKLASREVEIQGEQIAVTGMAKGSGMIHPNMATMLAYVTTNANVARDTLQYCLEQAVKSSFNSITVDGDTSTNDACVLVATAASEHKISSLDSVEGQAFAQAVNEVCMELARAIIHDAEGATKFVEVFVGGAASEDEARTVALTVAHSPLVKTALFASDPNWGRILAAVGRADIPEIDIERVKIWLNDVCIVSQGGRDAAYTEADGQAVMDLKEFTIHIDLGQGREDARILTSDLSFDYIKINAEYRS